MPKRASKRTENVTVRVSEEEHKRWEEQAKLEDLPLSTVIRQAMKARILKGSKAA